MRNRLKYACLSQIFLLLLISCERKNPTSTSPTPETLKNTITPSRPTDADLLNLENKAREIMSTVSFLTPIAMKDLSKTYLDDNYYKKFSASAFAVKYRKRIFLVSAGHVFSESGPANQATLYFGQSILPIQSKIAVSEVLDLAASDIGDLHPHPENAAEIEVSTGDLVENKTPLIVVCNDLAFSVPVRTGFFKKMEKSTDYGFDRSALELEFPGIGIQNGCSGSPVLDFEKRVRGIMVRAVPSGRVATAVPSKTLALFLDKEFFNAQ